jgi:hypothetical protein
MTPTLLILGPPVFVLFIGSAIMFARDKTAWRLVRLFGSLCFIVVVLSHVAETFQWLPAMGWGLPDSPGHYLDLFSAILGTILLSLSYLCARGVGGNTKG